MKLKTESLNPLYINLCKEIFNAMGTLIKSIAFENFYNYYGSYKDNLYEFTEGINIINADNNMGKSKFYNGFLWILDDKVYDSDDKRFWDAKASYERMASAKAKREENSFIMGVRIVFENDGIEYTIERRVQFIKEDAGWKTIPALYVNSLENNDEGWMQNLALLMGWPVPLFVENLEIISG